MELQRAVDETAREPGYDPLKVKQLETIEVFVSGKDTFVALPTRYGKSIIYALLPGVFNRLRGKWKI